MGLLWDLLSWVCLLGGSVFIVAGGIGIIRLPDFFTRLHAAGVTDTMGAALVLLGLAFQAGLTQVTLKLGLILLFLFFTGPTSSHALAKAALHDNVKPLLDDGQEREPSNN